MPTPHTPESAARMAERNRKIIEDICAGTPIKFVCEKFHRTRSRIHQIAKAAGVTIARQRRS